MLTRDNILEIQRETVDALNALKRQVAKMETKLEILDEFLRKVPDDNGQVANNGVYSNLRLTEAVLKTVDQSEHPQGLFVREIKSNLLEGGFQPNAKNFYVTVYTTCRRLAKREKIAEGEKNGKRSFKSILLEPKLAF